MKNSMAIKGVPHVLARLITPFGTFPIGQLAEINLDSGTVQFLSEDGTSVKLPFGHILEKELEGLFGANWREKK